MNRVAGAFVARALPCANRSTLAGALAACRSSSKRALAEGARAAARAASERWLVVVVALPEPGATASGERTEKEAQE